MPSNAGSFPLKPYFLQGISHYERHNS